MARSCGKHHLQGVWGRATPPAGSATGTLWVLSPLASNERFSQPGARGEAPRKDHKLHVPQSGARGRSAPQSERLAKER